MGECLIKIMIFSGLLVDDESDKSSNDKAVVTTTHQKYATDTTVREVIEGHAALWKLFSSLNSEKQQKHSFKLWDITTQPQKDITSWPLIDYPELTGPKSKTLHDAGCFPSGTWIALPIDMHPSQFSNADYDDVQYNKHTNLSETDNGKSTLLEFVDNSFGAIGGTSSVSSSAGAVRLLPSQVMANVTKRFESDEQIMNDNDSTSREEAIRLRLQHKVQQRQVQLERTKKLDERILMLEEQSSGKNKKVSNQVRKMLVKSRATGDKKLKMQDRIYFECVVDDNGAALSRQFAYFSPQATFASIASYFPSNNGGTNSEVLIKRLDRDDATKSTYRRFPVTLRVYEAIADKYLTEDVDTVVIRWYQDGEASTPSIMENDQTVDIDVSMEDVQTTNGETIQAADTAVKVADLGNSQTIIEDVELSNAIRAMDEASLKGKKPKKATASALKVRNMQMKMKAKGDAERIPKVEDRFFLQVVLVDIGNKATADPYFLARTDPIQRLLTTLPAVKDPSKWELLVPHKTENQYCIITGDNALILNEAEKDGVLKCFDQIILRPKE